jgi:hypothetical protein
MNKGEKKKNSETMTIARRVFFAGNTHVISLGKHIGTPRQWVEVTVKEITDLKRIMELQEQEETVKQKFKEEARKQ